MTAEQPIEMDVRWLDRITNTLPCFTFCGTHQLYRKACAHLGIAYPEDFVPKNVNACVHFYENEDGDSVCVVTMDLIKWFDKDQVTLLSMLVHEASHVVDEHFLLMNEKEPAREQRAYALQYVADELFREYRRQKEALTGRASEKA